ncbi:root hair specific 18 [Prunus dulcis]|uniref:Peroxidase n=1 Tax=Prunus dulcis TaxID=3755 RepID=A0A4Y1RMS1_PRUDU|nr:root hair specific 18 [Prunus dulcis]
MLGRLCRNFGRKSRSLVSGPGIGVMSGIPKGSSRVLRKFGTGPFIEQLVSGEEDVQNIPLIKMNMSSTAAVAVVAIGLVFLTFAGQCSGALEVGFYRGKCGRFVDVEGIVAGIVRTKFFRDRTIAAALIRMQFHDCFVNGCDASILLDGSASEKTAPPNLSVRGFDVIDAAKTAVESVCRGVVSCADIIAIATREAVYLFMVVKFDYVLSSGGGQYNVQTGRRDGLISLAANVDLPAPSISVPDSVAAFARKGLNMTDMNTGKPDPDMNVALLGRLRRICPQNSAGTNATNLDQNPQSSFIVDNSFYKEILARRGILQIDQELALDPITQATVTALANNGTNSFATKFGQAMVKLGAVEVLTGSQGEIRRSCRAVNKPVPMKMRKS